MCKLQPFLSYILVRKVSYKLVNTVNVYVTTIPKATSEKVSYKLINTVKV